MVSFGKRERRRKEDRNHMQTEREWGQVCLTAAFERSESEA